MAKIKTKRQAADMSRLMQQDAARLLGVTVRTLQRWGDAPRNADKTYDARKLVAWRLSQEAAVNDALLAVGTDSPALERYRTARAELAELEVATKRGELVDVQTFSDWWFDAATRLRKRLEVVQRRGGLELVDLARQAFQEATEAYQERFGK